MLRRETSDIQKSSGVMYLVPHPKRSAKESAMKYKHLKSMAHNFAHSFVSDMNYIDGAYITDELRSVLRSVDGQRMTIHWLPESSLRGASSPRLKKSVDLYSASLPTHLKRHSMTAEHIEAFSTEAHLTPQLMLVVESVIKDDRGVEHRQCIRHL